MPTTLTLIPVSFVNCARCSDWYCQKLSGGDQMVICLATALGSLDAEPEDELLQAVAISATAAPTATIGARRTTSS